MSIKLAEEDVFVDEEVELVTSKPSYCMGCGDILHHYSLLICAECLDDTCNKFLKLAETVYVE